MNLMKGLGAILSIAFLTVTLGFTPTITEAASLRDQMIAKAK